MLDRVAKDLIGKLAAAERAESSARAMLRGSSADVAKLIAEARARGIPTARLAQHLLRHRLGRAGTLAERQREAERLRKRRRRGTARPGKEAVRAKNEVTLKKRRVRSSKEAHMAERLIRRKTTTETEEEFVNEPDVEQDDDLDCEDDKKSAAAEDDDEDETEDEEDEGTED